MIRVLIADDQDLIRAGFRAIVETQPDMTVVGEAGDGQAAVAAARSSAPDVVLMDIRMPGTDGISATEKVTALDNPPRVLVLTTFDHDDYIFGALKAGASGFLLKNAPRDQLLTAIRTVANGEALLAPTVTRRIIETFVASHRPRRRSTSCQCGRRTSSRNSLRAGRTPKSAKRCSCPRQLSRHT